VLGWQALSVPSGLKEWPSALKSVPSGLEEHPPAADLKPKA